MLVEGWAPLVTRIQDRAGEFTLADIYHAVQKAPCFRSNTLWFYITICKMIRWTTKATNYSNVDMSTKRGIQKSVPHQRAVFDRRVGPS